MRLDCEITGATVVAPDGSYPAAIGIRDGRIATLSAEPSFAAARTIDADGLVALPGMVDQHVHFMDPGSTEREDFAHGSGAAAVGGVTTVIEHTHAHPVLTAADLESKLDHLQGRSIVDFGLAAHVFPDTLQHVPTLWARGVAMFKVFTCTTHGVPALMSDDLLRLFRTLRDLGARALVHCEDEFITEDNAARLHTAMRDDFGVIPEWRSLEAELVAVNMVALLTRLTGARVTVAHASGPATVELVERERERGTALTVESCPQYFYFDEQEVRRHGATRKFTPPARDLRRPNPLWESVAGGSIDVISSDHAPSTLQQKLATSIWDCPFGLPGVDTTLTLLLNAVSEEWLSLRDLVRTYSANPAQLLGLYPRKGAIQVGSDADIVLVDPGASRVLSNEQIVSKAGWTPFHGMRVRGYPVITLVRGTVVAEAGKVVSESGSGRFTAGPGSYSASMSTESVR